jgi:peptide/nickel transport system substrate-binding protein
MKHSTKKLVNLLLVLVLAIGALGVSYAQEEDTLTILFWQAASSVNPYISGGTKEKEAASLVIEPLARVGPDGTVVAYLAAEIPTLENGGVSEDLTTITWNLRDDILWSDGTAFTAADVVFTWQYCTDPETGCAQLKFFDGVENVEALDDFTVLVTFSGPTPYPYNPFVSAQSPIIQQAQFADCVGAAAQECSEQNFGPIGTGPYVVDEFRANDVVTYVANENYRDFDQGKPAFQRVIFKGGGDAESAARAVLETGEADYAWNLQIAPQLLSQMESAGLGTVVVGFGTSVEFLMLNQTNPSPDLDIDTRSVWFEDGSNEHPFLTDPVVFQALSLALDRDIMAEQLYGAAGKPTCNLIAGPPSVASTNNDACLVQDIDAANAMLDEAGIVDTDGDGIREKDGVPLIILLTTATNSVRQNNQALIKQWWQEIGVETNLRAIEGSVFFGSDPASPDTYTKFYADMEMDTFGSASVDMENYLIGWSRSNMVGPDSNFRGSNVMRFSNDEYEALATQLTSTGDLAERAALTIQMNDVFVQNGAIIPMIYRGFVSAYSNTIEGVDMNPWGAELWNVAEWTRVDG